MQVSGPTPISTCFEKSPERFVAVKPDSTIVIWGNAGDEITRHAMIVRNGRPEEPATGRNNPDHAALMRIYGFA